METTHEVTLVEDLALARADLRDMQRTVIALRSELEHAEIQRHAETQQAIQASAAELTQLKTTVGTLRVELEHARIERDRLLQQERAASHNELQMLQQAA